MTEDIFFGFLVVVFVLLIAFGVKFALNKTQSVTL